jgi:hypothetical protein
MAAAAQPRRDHGLVSATMTAIVDKQPSQDLMRLLSIGDAATALRFEYCFNIEIAQDIVQAAQDWG